MRKEKKHFKYWLIIIVCPIVAGRVAWLLTVRLEGEAPKIEIEMLSAYLGRSQEISLAVSDVDSGLRQLWVGLLKDGRESVLYDESFPSAGLFKGGTTQRASIKLPVVPPELGFSDGEAILRMVVRDYSWRDWWKGNKTYVEKPVLIDTRAPEIEVLTSAHNISQGGAGLVIYRTSEPCSESGIQVGSKIYRGQTGYYKDPLVYLAFFALGFDQDRDTVIRLTAVDLAGNPGKGGLNYYIRRKKFRKDRLNISDRFLKKKLPDFDTELQRVSGKSAVDRFLFINRDLRADNNRKITEICRDSDNQIYWRGVFSRLPNAANRARFADHRTYYYKKKKIDRQVHMGIDLASLANSPVPAANTGVVVFAAPLGIYGGTVIIDHGFGLFSMYSHLSFIAVKAGDKIPKDKTLGRTGSTGMAGGDHLHFSMLINDTFVNPVEWWDLKWIQNNVISKIEQVKTSLELGEMVHEEA